MDEMAQSLAWPDEEELIKAVSAAIAELEGVVTVKPIALLAENEVRRLPVPGSFDGNDGVEELGDGRALRAPLPEFGLAIYIGEEALAIPDVPASSPWQRFKYLLNCLVLWFDPPTESPRDVAVRKRAAALRRLSAMPEDVESLRQATRALRNARLRQRLCSGLKSLGTDLNEIYKPLVKLLLPAAAISQASSSVGAVTLSIGGLSLNVVAIAIIAIVVARAGIESFCSDPRCEPE